MRKKHIVQLTDSERSQLVAITKKGMNKARTIKRANILLMSAEGQTDKAITNLLQTSTRTIGRTRKRFHENGLEAALYEQPRSGRPRKLDGKQEALLVAFVCSEPPAGRSCWTMQLLADKLVTLQVIDSISDETVRRILKKMNLNLGKKPPGVSLE